MKKRQKIAASAIGGNSAEARRLKPYTPPTLVMYGSVDDLTAGTSMGGEEKSPDENKKRPPGL